MAAGNGATKLIAAIGVPAAALVVAFVQFSEGNRPTPYKDVAGIQTVCYGSTKNVDPSRTYTQKECEERLINDLTSHAEGVKACVTQPMTTGQLAAFTSFAYNVGVNRFCASTLVEKFNAGDAAGACAELKRWVHAGGKVQRGLVIRRDAEYKMCME